MAFAAICVLGCRSGSPALARRARTACDVFRSRKQCCESGEAGETGETGLVLVCGGLEWAGRVEADDLARMLKDGGVPDEAIVRERQSRDTHENAVNAARILRERGIEDVILVTCSWHVPRAKKLFSRVGLNVIDTVGAPPPKKTTIAKRAYWAARERIALLKDVLR